MVIEGKCGESAVYTFNDETGHLVISGTGTIRKYAFDVYEGKETEKMLASDIKTVVIEDGISIIGSHAFEGCKSLTNVTIGNNVISIGYSAFSGCTNLTSITIPSNVTYIGSSAFYGCTSLTSITIPDGVTCIGVGVFENCTSLTDIIISNSVTTIGDGAFYNCTNLKTKKQNYKAFSLVDNKIFCKNYEYTENEWSETLDNIKPCRRGYHYCDNLFNIFNHYSGVIDKDIVIYECEVGDIVIKCNDKFVTNRIKPVKRLYREDVIKILNEGVE